MTAFHPVGSPFEPYEAIDVPFDCVFSVDLDCVFFVHFDRSFLLSSSRKLWAFFLVVFTTVKSPPLLGIGIAHSNRRVMCHFASSRSVRSCMILSFCGSVVSILLSIACILRFVLGSLLVF